jgi:hypothetical protein
MGGRREAMRAAFPRARACTNRDSGAIALPASPLARAVCRASDSVKTAEAIEPGLGAPLKARSHRAAARARRAPGPRCARSDVAPGRAQADRPAEAPPQRWAGHRDRRHRATFDNAGLCTERGRTIAERLNAAERHRHRAELEAGRRRTLRSVLVKTRRWPALHKPALSLKSPDHLK